MAANDEQELSQRVEDRAMLQGESVTMGMLQKLENLKRQQLAKAAKPTFKVVAVHTTKENPVEAMETLEHLGFSQKVQEIIDCSVQRLVNEWLARPDHEVVNYLGMVALLAESDDGAYLNLLPLEEGITNLRWLAEQRTLVYMDRFDSDIRKPVPGHMHKLPIYVFVRLSNEKANVGIFFMGKKA